jgi:hypothetical protein
MSCARVIFFLLWQFGAPRKERALVIPCLFVVYRWTAHPNIAPVVQSPNTRTPQYVSLAFPLACVPMRFRRERKQGTAGIVESSRETAVGEAETEDGR